MLNFKLLGTAAGGGIPQWNCACKLCDLCRKSPEIVQPRMQLQASFSADAENWFLINASPDLRMQIEAHPELQPSSRLGKRNTPIRGIILTSADLDQVLGVLLLREFQPLTLYATALVREVLESNSFFRMLHRVPDQLTWVEISPQESFTLGGGITCTPIPFQGGLPYYARESHIEQPGQTTLGLVLEADGQRLAYTPSVPEVTDELRDLYDSCDAILVDGTFWSDEELSSTHAGTPLARSIGHVPMSGDDGTLSLLNNTSARQKIYVHINNTNPVLDPRSAEYKLVVDAGWQIGHDGWQLN
ncbi:pyrroloquinoline quinone biosynthesis protein PqqB [Granulicella mallensis]|uniref:Coenzyme PQQ synthesis protein B n=1 Tax=Granulicella mallensis TaxID=940614 RepID=A0A7W7ZMQ5_9BACT|nr:pyrroloquinoline quinone biosynthesis protein PqqB [Granulicella mallensis]MBB5062444.1 pyrroloquinoline quinone biosynthesis protein B [Granulicella mallensis]